MKLTSLTVGSIGTNCYILYNEATKAAVVIDPSDEATLVEARIEALGLQVQAILLTHGHFDHGGDVARIRMRTGAPVYLHPADRALPSWLTHGLSDTEDLAEGDTLDFAGLRFSVLHTPGHTPGSMCFRLDHAPVLFSGDTMFRAGFGRVDLHGGNMDELIASLRRLFLLPPETRVLPGHGEETTIGEERARYRL